MAALPAPALLLDRRPPHSERVVSSWKLRDTAARRARAASSLQNGGRRPANHVPSDQASSIAAVDAPAPDLGPARGIGLGVVSSWRLRNTPSSRARALAQAQKAPTIRQKRRPRCSELNLDVLFDILLRVPAKDLCRLRAVCRPWRSLTTDSIFIGWHTRHRGPLFLVKFRHDPAHIHVMDVSATVMKTFVNTSAAHRSKVWRMDIMGPISGDHEAVKKYHDSFDGIALAELKGSLVLVYYHQLPDILELWFLTDPENGIWVKEYSIRLLQEPRFRFLAMPLSVLDDGRLVIFQDATGLLRIYNPETHRFAEVRMRPIDSVSMFTGSLSNLEQDHMV